MRCYRASYAQSIPYIQSSDLTEHHQYCRTLSIFRASQNYLPISVHHFSLKLPLKIIISFGCSVSTLHISIARDLISSLPHCLKYLCFTICTYLAYSHRLLPVCNTTIHASLNLTSLTIHI